MSETINKNSFFFKLGYFSRRSVRVTRTEQATVWTINKTKNATTNVAAGWKTGVEKISI